MNLKFLKNKAHSVILVSLNFTLLKYYFTTYFLFYDSCLVGKSCPTLLRPHGLQPTRLLRPWDFPGKSKLNKQGDSMQP